MSELPYWMTLRRQLHNIAIGGRKGHGKDSFGTYLAMVYDYKLTAFATPLRLKAAEVLRQEQGYTLDEALAELLHPVRKERWRVLLQNIGQEERERDEDHWVKASGISNAVGLNATTDTRYLNEIRAIEKKGGISVFIQARWREVTPAEDPTLSHSSEALGAEAFDLTLAVPRGLNEVIHCYGRFCHALDFPKADQSRVEEYAIWLKSHIEKGQQL